MAKKIVTVEQAMEHIHDNMTLMIGGFMSVGTPEVLISGILAKGVKDLHIIANDTGVPGKGIGRLVEDKRVTKLTASHIGLHPETGVQINSGYISVTLVPQGSLAEKIRAGGAGLGGVLTPTGIGTEIETGKQKLTIEGKEYLLELPLKADVALIRGSIVDEDGNIYYNGTTRNFNPMMALAADIVIVGAEKIVKAGELDPNSIATPAPLVDYIVGGEI